MCVCVCVCVCVCACVCVCKHALSPIAAISLRLLTSYIHVCTRTSENMCLNTQQEFIEPDLRRVRRRAVYVYPENKGGVQAEQGC